VPFSVCSSRYKVGAFPPMLGRRLFLGVRSGIRSVPFSLVTSMYQAYRIRYSNPTLLAPSISCFTPYLPVLACGGLSHHSVLSFPNQNPRLGSICGETTELDGREPFINTPPHLSRHPKGIREKERFWLEERSKRVRRYDTTRP